MNLLLNLCFVGERDRSKFDLPRFHRVVVLFQQPSQLGAELPKICLIVIIDDEHQEQWHLGGLQCWQQELLELVV